MKNRETTKTTQTRVTGKEGQTVLSGERAPDSKNTHIPTAYAHTDNVCVCESTGIDPKRDTPNETGCKLCFSLGRAKNLLVKGDFHTLSASILFESFTW